MVRNASLIAIVGGEGNLDYLLQVRNINVSKFKPGEYPFTFPGACSFPGGEIEDTETPQEGFNRELKEEIPSLVLPKELEHRLYDWNKQIGEVLERANNALNGNLYSILGFDLDSKIPKCALGKWRDKNLTYRDFLNERVEHFYIAKLNSQEKVDIKEGAKSIWLPYDVMMSIVMYPGDKLALLDDITKRLEAGEIALR